jgi:hypothetical protein
MYNIMRKSEESIVDSQGTKINLLCNFQKEKRERARKIFGRNDG